MTSYTLRVDEADKRAASEVAEYYGFDLASVTRAFYKQMARTGCIPPELRTEQPNEESLQAIHETEEMLRSGSGRGFTCGKDLIEAAMA